MSVHPASIRVAKPNGWWAMLCVVATEGALFGAFIASFFYLRFRAVHWPPPGTAEPKLVVPCLLTGVLVATSIPMQIASIAAQREQLRLARRALALALLVGSGYLAMQIDRFAVSLHTLRPQESSYASLVYLIQGGHHAHVLVGLLLNAYMLVKLSRGLNGYRTVGVQAVALYWHFVNVLAVAVLLTLSSPSL
jgi:heme/copper-type cytochrome/quinol oxidase subunit 3